MFSFFKTKKPSPSSSPESDPIPSASNDFEIVNPQGPGARPNTAPYPYAAYPYPIYPNFDNVGNPSLYPPALPNLPNLPNRPPLQHSESMSHSNYLNGVPFKLSPQISTGNANEILRIQVDDILASITSKMYITQLDYDFSLERSIIQQCETESTEAEAEAETESAPADE